MGKYLSDDERQLSTEVDDILEWERSSSFNGDLRLAMAVENGHVGNWKGYENSVSDLKRIAEATADCLSLFNKLPANPNGFAANIIGSAEEAGLPDIEVLKILEDLPKNNKFIPSIAEFNEMFAERAEHLQRATKMSRRILDEYRKESEKTFICLTDAVDGIRVFLPDFPAPEVLDNSWQQIFHAPFGCTHDGGIDSNGGKIEGNRQRMTAFRAGMQVGDFWPAVPMYCIHLAAQIPAKKRLAVTNHVDGLCEDGFQGCDDPSFWHSLVAKASTFPDEEKLEEILDYEPLSTGFFFLWWLLRIEQRDEINANWQAKLDTDPRFPQPIILGATQ
ncbi:MAG: hypothetical protein ISR51_03555 [Rhodospirillales bacterium]|nr:hypothetical protein [Rhodospirillales bacterium]